MYNDNSFVKAAEGSWLEAAGWSQFTNFIHQAGYFLGLPTQAYNDSHLCKNMDPGVESECDLHPVELWKIDASVAVNTSDKTGWNIHRVEVPPRVFQNLWLQFELLILYTISCPLKHNCPASISFSSKCVLCKSILCHLPTISTMLEAFVFSCYTRRRLPRIVAISDWTIQTQPPFLQWDAFSWSKSHWYQLSCRSL